MSTPPKAERERIYQQAAYARLAQLGEVDFIQQFDTCWALALFPSIPFLPSGELGNMPDGEYIYLIADKSQANVYKIGRSAVLKSRMKRFEVKLPIPIECTMLLRVGDAKLAERRLHDLYSQHRVKGEWFRLGLRDLLKIVDCWPPLEHWTHPQFRQWVNELVPGLVTDKDEIRQPIDERDVADLLDGLF